jgi:hypothetical protein
MPRSVTIKSAPVGMRAIRAPAIRYANRPPLERAAPLCVDGIPCRVSIRHPADDAQPHQLLKGALVNLSARAIAIRVVTDITGPP